MNGKIDRDGRLWIERGGKWVLMQCPHRMSQCSHFCPLFGEPDTEGIGLDEDGDFCSTTDLTICDKKTLIFHTFTDERKEA